MTLSNGLIAIQRIVWFVLRILIYWIVICTVNSIIHPLNNWILWKAEIILGQMLNSFSGLKFVNNRKKKKIDILVPWVVITLLCHWNKLFSTILPYFNKIFHCISHDCLLCVNLWNTRCLFLKHFFESYRFTSRTNGECN